MIVFCDQVDCINNGLEAKDYQCQCTLINLYGEECGSYRSFRETNEYQDRFYKSYSGARIGLPDGLYKLAAKGKRLLLNGLELFTENDDRCPDSEIIVTERITGACAALSSLKEYTEDILNRIKEHDPVDKLLEIEKDPEHYGKYCLKQPEPKGSEA